MSTSSFEFKPSRIIGNWAKSEPECGSATRPRSKFGEAELSLLKPPPRKCGNGGDLVENEMFASYDFDQSVYVSESNWFALVSRWLSSKISTDSEFCEVDKHLMYSACLDVRTVHAAKGL